MEQVRLILAVVLSILVLLVWQFFFVVRPEQPAGPDAQPPKGISGSGPVETAVTQTPPAAAPEAAGDVESTVAVTPEEAGAPVFVETDLYSAVISGNGAHLSEFVLKRYRETNDPKSSLKALVSKENATGTLLVSMEGAGLDRMESGAYMSDAGPDPVTVANTPRTITFSRHFAGGVVVDKSYTFVPDSYMVGLDITVKNGAAAPLSGSLAVTLARYFADDKAQFVFEGPSALVNGDLEEIKLEDIGKKEAVSGHLGWISIQNRYFMEALIPSTPAEGVMRLARTPEQMVTATYLQPAETVAAGGSRTWRFTVFMGPKSVDLLRKAGHDLDRAVNFGWFDFIARPCLWLMNFLYRFIPNYGIAIIIITILFKVIFWPLGNKSYKSMADMKRLAPLMAEIREKYKDDRKKMNEEVMNLYRTYKINPLGGCLPILVQIPVFFAFYRMLYQSIELRHAPFFLWIDDLSAPDRLFHFDIALPLIAPPVGIPVLTIVMGATMLIQQKLQPPMGDPAQAKIMMLMPIFFTFIFINFPSGLVLYWLVNNVISIFQQYYITRKNT